MADTAMPLFLRVSRATSTKSLIDILVLFAVSGLAFALENMANARGWIVVADDAHGVSAVVAGALAAVGMVFARGGSFADLGFKRPDRWLMVPVQVAAILGAFIAAQGLVPLLVSSFMTVPQPDMSRYAAISGNVGAAVTLALLLPLTASIPEEIIYRGFLIGRLTAIFGTKTRGVVLAVLAQALLFGAVHFQWGIGGMIMTVVMGIVWGTGYLLCGRNLWIVILAHSTGHVLFVIQLYLAKPLVI